MDAEQQRKMRVKIARDVIFNLNNKLIQAKAGTYCTITNYRTDAAKSYKGKQLQKILPKIYGKCEVCALGAAVISAVKLNNDWVHDKNYISNTITAGRFDVLHRYFSYEQRRLIEQAFEQVCGFEGWSEQDPEKRMRAIMKNIIKNKGEFIPTGEMAGIL